MSRPHQKVSEEYLSKMKNKLSSMSGAIKDDEEFVRLTNRLTNCLSSDLERELVSAEDIKNQKTGNGGEWCKPFADIRQSYNLLYRKYSELVSEENSIHRIERKSHTIALIFRFLTTLAIGFGIMSVYFVAAELGIQMPLLRLPV